MRTPPNDPELDARIAAAVADVEAGMSQRQAAEKHSVARYQIRKALTGMTDQQRRVAGWAAKAQGEGRRTREPRAKTVAATLVRTDVALDLRDRGLSWAQIADRMGVSQSGSMTERAQDRARERLAVRAEDVFLMTYSRLLDLYDRNMVVADSAREQGMIQEEIVALRSAESVLGKISQLWKLEPPSGDRQAAGVDVLAVLAEHARTVSARLINVPDGATLGLEYVDDETEE